MKPSMLFDCTAACFCLDVVVPLLAAPVQTNAPSPGVKALSVFNSGGTCRSDLHAVNGQMEQDGYWLGGSDFRAGGYGDDYSYASADALGYGNARPGYDIRILPASAIILTENRQQQACEGVLDTPRGIYNLYLADMHRRGLRPVDKPGWQQKQMASAQPVTAEHASFRSDQACERTISWTRIELRRLATNS